VIEAVKIYDPELILVTLAGSLCAQMASDAGLRVAREVFPDRAYLNNAQLAPRSMTGAVIHDPEEVKERVIKLVRTGKLTSIDGFQIALEMDTLCVHGDNPGAWQLARTIRESHESSRVRVVPMGIK
jgi:5-oxoprolinase (ATP-hydrolysing) subunit A